MKNSVTFISASAITERRKSKNSIYASVLELRFFDDEEFGFKFPLELHKRAKKKKCSEFIIGAQGSTRFLANDK